MRGRGRGHGEGTWRGDTARGHWQGDAEGDATRGGRVLLQVSRVGGQGTPFLRDVGEVGAGAEAGLAC